MGTQRKDWSLLLMCEQCLFHCNSIAGRILRKGNSETEKKQFLLPAMYSWLPLWVYCPSDQSLLCYSDLSSHTAQSTKLVLSKSSFFRRLFLFHFPCADLMHTPDLPTVALIFSIVHGSVHPLWSHSVLSSPLLLLPLCIPVQPLIAPSTRKAWTWEGAWSASTAMAALPKRLRQTPLLRHQGGHRAVGGGQVSGCSLSPHAAPHVGCCSWDSHGHLYPTGELWFGHPGSQARAAAAGFLTNRAD